MQSTDGLTYEELNGEIVVLDAGAQLVHRITGETADAVRGERDEMTRRRMIQAAVALGVAGGVSSIALPSAAAAASGASEPELGSTYYGYAGDPGVSKPTGVAAVAGDSQVTVSWEPVEGATGYRVYRRELGAMSYTLAWKGSGTSTVISSLTNGTTYQFAVVTVKNGQVSTESTPQSATPVASGKPSMPENLAIERQPNGENAEYGYLAQLSWTRGAGGPEPTVYYVAWRTDPWGEFTVPTDPPGGPTTTMMWVTWDSVSNYFEYFEFEVSAATPAGSSNFASAVLDLRGD